MKILEKTQMLIYIISLDTCGYVAIPDWNTVQVCGFVNDSIEDFPNLRYVKPSQMAIMYASFAPNISNAIGYITEKFNVPKCNQVVTTWEKRCSKEDLEKEAAKIRQMSNDTRILFIITVNSDLGKTIDQCIFDKFCIPQKNITRPATIERHPIEIIELSKLNNKRPHARYHFYQPNYM